MTARSVADDLVVIVPYFNERDNLPYLLHHLAAQTLLPHRVLLVDSSSTDDGPSIVDKWIATSEIGANFTNVRARTTTPGGSKSFGIAASSESLLAFMDCGLAFPVDWLEQQLRVLNDPRVSWVSGVCRTEGGNLIDRAAIAHTYGFRNQRAVIPSSVIRREVFERCGVFKNLRAGYDAEWARHATRHGELRVINSQVVVRYHDINYSRSLRGVFMKTLRYARPSVYRDDYLAPWIYLCGALIGAIASVIAPQAGVLFAAAYLAARLLLAGRKSRRNIWYFVRNPVALITLIVVGIVMDAGKLMGFTLGIGKRFMLRRDSTH